MSAVSISPSALTGEFAVPRPTESQIRRLKRAKQVILNRLSDENNQTKFNMAVWYVSEGEGCQTAACAAGWCALDPVLASEGLHLENDTFAGYGHTWPVFQNDQGLNACKSFFGCNGIFDPYNYQEPRIARGRGIVLDGAHMVKEEDVVNAIDQQLKTWGIMEMESDTDEYP